VEVLRPPSVTREAVGTAASLHADAEAWWVTSDSVGVVHAASPSENSTGLNDDDDVVSIWASVSAVHLVWLLPVFGFVLLIGLCTWRVASSRSKADEVAEVAAPYEEVIEAAPGRVSRGMMR